MTANVPTSEKGSARLGMIVADRLRRKRKITRTTSANVSESVNCTSASEARIDSERSERSCRSTDAGSSCLRLPPTRPPPPPPPPPLPGRGGGGVGGREEENTAGPHSPSQILFPP